LPSKVLVEVLLPLVEVSKKWMKNMSERQVIDKWVKDNEKMSQKPNLKLAKNKLKLIYDQINENATPSKIKCDETTFIATILAGKPSDNLDEAKWQRIKYWS
jgi:hypothetical protein